MAQDIAKSGFFNDQILSVQIQLLDECNLNCAHCYGGIDLVSKGRSAPSLSAVRYWLDRLKAFSEGVGFRAVDPHFSGGEPLLRDDILEIVTYAVDLGMEPLLMTNGTLFTDDMAEMLKRAGLEYVQFSVEGFQDVNDAIRGPGSFTSIMRAVDVAKSAGMRPTLSVTVSDRNVDGLFDFIRTYDFLDIMFHLREMLPLGNGAHLKCISVPQRLQLLEFVRDFDGISRIDCEDPIHCSIPDGELTGGCGAMRSHFCIDTDGSIFPCRLLAQKFGHINNLEQAYFCKDAVRLRNRHLEGLCSDCRLKSNCGGCRAYAFLKTGNCLESDDRCFMATHTPVDESSGCQLQMGG